MPRKEKNKFRMARLFSLTVILLSAALFFVPVVSTAKNSVRSADSGSYRVYFMQTGAVQKKEHLGKGKFRQLDYKLVFQDQWTPSETRQVEVAFVDADGFKLASELVPDKSMAPYGEYYGSVWVRDKQWKKITGVAVKEIRPKEQKVSEPPPAPEPLPTPEPEKTEDTTPKGLFDYGKTTYTDEMILKELEDRRVPLTPAPENLETEEVDPDSAEVTKAVIEEG